MKYDYNLQKLIRAINTRFQYANARFEKKFGRDFVKIDLPRKRSLFIPYEVQYSDSILKEVEQHYYPDSIK